MSGKELPNGMRSVVGEIMDHCKGRLGKFRREEDGSLLIFGLFCLVMMMFLAGAALDLMRYEERRTTLQNTVDRAVLAAADLRQTLPPKEVVKDYFRKAGLKPPSDNEIVVNQGTFNEWRTVQANVSETMPTWFMRMVDIKTMTPIGAGTAEERVGQVEISLVLDVSGSMNSNNRLTNLKPAAKAFIDQMFDTVEPGKLSISLITYSTQVSAGPQLLQYFDRDANSQHNKSSCLEFNSGDFNTTAMYPSGSGHTYRQNGHFDPFYRTSNIDSYGLWNCPKDANESYRHTLAYSGNRTALKNAIDALQAAGNTSIDLGLKWGAGLLDPSMAPVVQSMIASGHSPASFSERPYAYSDDEALKVIVVMTDGVNTTEYKLDSDYSHGGSRIWKTNSYSGLDQYSFYDPSRSSSSKYYSMRTDSWRTAPYGSNPQQMTWPEVWEEMSIWYVADYIIRPIYGSTERNRWRSGYSNSKTSSYVNSQKDSQTLAVCSAAKAHKNVKIFAIGFEAPSNARTLLKSCASSQAHYYDANGGDLPSVFSSIASSINKLRLTH